MKEGNKTPAYEYTLNHQDDNFTLSITNDDSRVSFRLIKNNSIRVFTTEITMTDIKQLDVFCKSQNVDHFIKSFDRLAKSGGAELKACDSSLILCITELNDGYHIKSWIELTEADIGANDLSNRIEIMFKSFADKHKEEVRKLREELRETKSQLKTLKKDFVQLKNEMEESDEPADDDEDESDSDGDVKKSNKLSSTGNLLKGLFRPTRTFKKREDLF
jgi:hypothetical protein